MSEAVPSGLRLRAEDEEDLAILSAAAQDSIFKVGDLHYDARARRFSAALNRFRWEKAKRARGPYERVRAALAFDGVQAVRVRRLRQDAKDAAGVLLRVTFAPGAEPPEGEIVLTLAGDGEIRLAVECVDATLTDIGAPWLTPHKPEHEKG